MSLIRVQKNKDNPYVILNKEFLEDESISLKLKGFLAYCLSKPDDWQFHVLQLASVLKEGRKAIYNIIKEGIEHGYIQREQKKIGNRFADVDYIIHETKLKKCLPLCPFGDTEKGDAQKEALVINNSTNNDKTKTLTSADATRLASLLLETIQKTKPNFRPPPPPTLKKWEEVINLMLSKDSISVDRIESVLRWLPSNDFWKTNILSANTLRKQFDALELKMEADARGDKKPGSIQAPPEIQESNKILVQAIKSRFKELVNKGEINIGYNYIEFIRGMLDDKILFTENGFKDRCLSVRRKMSLPVTDL